MADRRTRFHDLFRTRRPIIGMISLPPLPGCAGAPPLPDVIAAALADLEALQRGGADGVLVENDFDRPHQLTVGPEIVAAMTRVTDAVVGRAAVPVGVQVLLNDWRASIAVAAASQAHFVRLDFFVDRVRIAAGVIEPEPEAVLVYRAALGAAHLAIFADIQVKYSTLLEEGKPLARSALQAAEHGADAVVVTGSATGVAPAAEDLAAARAGGIPVLIGSGLTGANAPALLPHADGAIVGTALRSGGGPFDRVAAGLVRDLISASERLRSAGDRAQPGD